MSESSAAATPSPDRYESDNVIWYFGSEMPEAVRPGGPGVDQQSSPSQKAAPPRRPVPLMEGLRNLEKGYDRKFALAYCADDVWNALEALERIANHDLQVDYADCELRTIARRALA